MAREKGPTRDVPAWILREAGGLLVLGASLYLFLSLWATGLTGEVGRLVANPLSAAFGRLAFLFPLLGIFAAVHALRDRPGWSPLRWAAWLAVAASGSLLVELAELAPPRVLGGIFGEFLGRVVLGENFGTVGSYCLLLPVFVLALLAATSTSMAATAANIRTAARSGRDWLGERFRRSREAKAPEVARPARLKRTENVKRPKTDEAPPPIFVERAPKTEPPPSKKKATSQEAFSFAGNFRLPSPSQLDSPPEHGTRIDEDSLIASSRILEAKLADFGVAGKVTAVRPGPVITTFEFEPAPGVKVNRIVTLADDLSMALRAMSVRILAPIPGKSVVGIEVSNPKREKVFLREILESTQFQGSASKLTLALGKDSVGNPVVSDLARMPHLLVAGATGMGKSVSLNAMIMSILYKATPDDVRFLMIDPKMLELSLYENIPHLLTRVVIDPKEAFAALSRAVVEMENRYRLLREKGVRNIDSYNRVLEREAAEKIAGVVVLREAEPNDPSEGWKIGDENPVKETLVHRRLPYILIVIDELADLMLTSGRQIEEQITRLAQKARAAGIHLIVATQRPSVDVITGLIKANFPARVSFQTTSRIDSRTILDAIGAERLLGDGDMLFMPPGTSRQVRIHGAFVSEPEIRKVTGFLKDQARPVYDQDFTQALDQAHEEKSEDADDEGERDELYEQAVELVTESRQASISWLQRRLRVGYNRAARMIERMEREGLVGASDGVRPREVRIRGEQ